MKESDVIEDFIEVEKDSKAGSKRIGQLPNINTNNVPGSKFSSWNTDQANKAAAKKTTQNVDNNFMDEVDELLLE